MEYFVGMCRVSLPSMLDLSFCSTSDDVQHITFVAIVGELGCASAYLNLGNSHFHGRAVEIDIQKAKDYWELAAMGGKVKARYYLGYTKAQTGNYQRAMKHVMISALVTL